MAGSSLMQSRLLATFQGTNPFQLGFNSAAAAAAAATVPSLQNLAAAGPTSSTSDSSTSAVSSSTSTLQAPVPAAAAAAAASLTLPVYPFHLPPTSFALNFNASNAVDTTNNTVTAANDKAEADK